MSNFYISIIGGANIDIQGFPLEDLILHDSNPGKVRISLGGVGRNIGREMLLLLPLAYGHYNNIGIEESTKMAIAASILALSHEDTINPDMCVQCIKSKMKEISIC